jgi:hypothetical protein
MDTHGPPDDFIPYHVVSPFPAFQVERPPGLDDYLYSADQR